MEIFKKLQEHIKFMRYKKDDEFVVNYIKEILEELRKEKLELQENKEK